MVVSINGSEIGRIIDFNMSEGSEVQTPEWLNTQASINPNVYNRTLASLNYIFSLNDAQRYVLEKAFRNHTTVQLVDDIYGQINANVWVTDISVTWDSSNYYLPWQVTITVLGIIR